MVTQGITKPLLTLLVFYFTNSEMRSSAFSCSKTNLLQVYACNTCWAVGDAECCSATGPALSSSLVDWSVALVSVRAQTSPTFTASTGPDGLFTHRNPESTGDVDATQRVWCLEQNATRFRTGEESLRFAPVERESLDVCGARSRSAPPTCFYEIHLINTRVFRESIENRLRSNVAS